MTEGQRSDINAMIKKINELKEDRKDLNNKYFSLFEEVWTPVVRTSTKAKSSALIKKPVVSSKKRVIKHRLDNEEDEYDRMHLSFLILMINLCLLLIIGCLANETKSGSKKRK
jgi:hypothetical protein